MVVKVQVKVNRAGVQRMLHEPYMWDHLYWRATLVVIEAERIAPVRTGQYAFGTNGKPGGFQIERVQRVSGAAVRIVNRAPYAIFLERGTSKMRPQRIMQRALRAARR